MFVGVSSHSCISSGSLVLGGGGMLDLFLQIFDINFVNKDSRSQPLGQRQHVDLPILNVVALEYAIL